MEAESKSCRLSKLRQNASGVSIEKWAKVHKWDKGGLRLGYPSSRALPDISSGPEVQHTFKFQTV